MAVVSLLLGSMIGFTSALFAFFMMGVSFLAAVGLWSLIGAGATVMLVSFALIPQREKPASRLAENA